MLGPLTYGALRSGGAGEENPWYDPDGDGLSVVAAYQPIGAESFATSKVNIANEGTHDLANGATLPTWNTDDGWIFGSESYLATDILPVGTWTFVVRFSDGVASGESFLFGVFDGTSSNNKGIAYHSSGNIRYTNPNNATVNPYILSGVLAIAGAKGYRNGAVDTAALTVGGTSTKVLWIGALNNNGSAYGTNHKKIQALAIYDETLTDDQVAAVTTAMAALTP